MGATPIGKVQLNIYVPESIDQYVEEVRETIELTKSEFVHLLIAYAKRNMSMEDIKALSQQMLLFGESGLEEVVHNVG